MARSPTRPPSPAAPPETHPLAAHRALLGTVADEVIAARAGVSRNVVGAYRRKLGIAAYDGFKFVKGHVGLQASAAGTTSTEPASSPTRTVRPRPAQALERFRDRLGKEPDGTIAAEAGLERTTVGSYRRSLGIDAYRPVAGVPAQVVLAPVGAPEPPAAVEPTPAPPAAQPERKSKLAPYAHLIGKLPDAQVAAQAGASLSGVQAYRQRHRIPAPPPVASPPLVKAPAAEPPPGVTARPSKLDAHRDIVGVLFDSVVAQIAGFTPEGVRQYRKRHGISAGALRVVPTESAASSVAPVESVPIATTPPQLAGPTFPPVPAVLVAELAAPEVPAPASSTVPSHRAFTIVAEAGVETRRFMVVAVHVGVAAMRAYEALGRRADGPWHVRSVEDVGEALG